MLSSLQRFSQVAFQLMPDGDFGILDGNPPLRSDSVLDIKIFQYFQPFNERFAHILTGSGFVLTAT